MSFEEWIEQIEDEGTNIVGLKHCSLDHRRALRAAFEAGQANSHNEQDCLDYMRERDY